MHSGKYEKCQQWLEKNLPDLAGHQLRITTENSAGGGKGDEADETTESGKKQVGNLGIFCSAKNE
jgi:hypothetical protein